MKTFLIIFSLLFSTMPTFALETTLSLTFWYDNTPPTQKDKKFFNGVKTALQTLKNNNDELEEKAKNKNISLIDDNTAKKIVNKLLKEHNIDNNFFYNLEKAQLIMVVKMLVNNSKVSNEYTEKDALNYSDQFIVFAEKETSKNRDISKNISFNIDDVLLGAMVGGFVVSMVNSMFNSTNVDNTYNDNSLQNSLFGSN